MLREKNLKIQMNQTEKLFVIDWNLDYLVLVTIGGVNAIKFGIYYSPKDKKYVYNEKKFRSAEEAYKKILTQINTLLKSGKQFTQDNDWKKLSDAFERVDEIKSIVKSKILAVYFPDSIVSINSHNGIKQILKLLFHIPDEEIQKNLC